MKNDNDIIKLNNYIDNFDIKRNIFFRKLKDIHKNFFENDENTPLEGYYINYPSSEDY